MQGQASSLSLSYWLIGSRMSASDTDLPVLLIVSEIYLSKGFEMIQKLSQDSGV